MDKITQFVSVTGASESVARTYLDACGGDLNMAIGMHLESSDSGENSGVVPASAASVSDSVLSPESYEKIHGVRAPIPQTTGVLLEEEPPPRKILRSRKLPQTIFDPFQDYSAVASRAVHSNKQDSNRARLAELFRPPYDLLFNGTFHEAKLAGQQRMCWLLVNLQDSKEFSSQMLNRDIWSNHNVKELIKTNFIFLQIHRINDEGVRFKQLYHIESYPCVTIIDPRTGEKMLSWNSLTVDTFMQEASEFLINNPYRDDNSMEQKNIINQSEESQLEAAIRASLDQTESTRQTIVFSDDSDTDCICLSPERDSSSSKPRSSVKSIGASSFLPSEMVDGEDRNPGSEGVDLTIRKRSGREDMFTEVSRKKVRTDLEPVCTAMNSIELARSLSSEILDVTEVNGKGKGRKVNKGKGKMESGRRPKKHGNTIMDNGDDTTVSLTIEEQLASGAIHKSEVSQILFRLPDGTRLQKYFLCSSLIRELLTFLEDQGFKLSEHEVLTHFPKRSLLDMDHDTSLKHNGLYPRETVFVHTV